MFRQPSTPLTSKGPSGKGLHYLAMSDKGVSYLQFLKGQEICLIGFGMYDLPRSPGYQSSE